MTAKASGRRPDGSQGRVAAISCGKVSQPSVESSVGVLGARTHKEVWMKLSPAALTLVGLSFMLVPAIAFGQEVVSDIPNIMAAKATRLPEGPRPARDGDNCSSYFPEPTTEAGRYAQQRGWGVISEVPIGDYHLVSFAGEFVTGTSGSCAIRQGNIGVFEGRRLKAILYTASRADELIGVLVARGGNSARIWSGDYLPQPIADISAGSVGLIVSQVADEDTLCEGAVTVPNIYDQPITQARNELIASGWKAVPQPLEEWGQQPDLHELGVTETETCSGTGFGFCRYAYETPSAKLNVTTAGELFEGNVPGVTDYSVNCSP